MLEGRQFYPWEVNDALEAARTYSWKKYIDEDDANWLQSNVAVSAAAVEMRKRADAQSNNEAPATLYRRGDEGWNLVDAALRPFAGVSAVENEVANLPQDLESPAGPSWVKPLIIGGVAFTTIGLGLWWVLRSGRMARRRRGR